MAFTHFTTGTVTLGAASDLSTMTISGLGFVPTGIIIAMTSVTGNSTQRGSVYGTNGYVYSGGVDSNDNYTVMSRAATFSYGTTTTIKISSSNYNWWVGNYQYVAWREE